MYAEAADVDLAKFVKKMLHRPDAEETVIILRADHGLQGGYASLPHHHCHPRCGVYHLK